MINKDVNLTDAELLELNIANRNEFYDSRFFKLMSKYEYKDFKKYLIISNLIDLGLDKNEILNMSYEERVTYLYLFYDVGVQ